jgi:hypothetical protein
MAGARVRPRPRSPGSTRCGPSWCPVRRWSAPTRRTRSLAPPTRRISTRSNCWARLRARPAASIRPRPRSSGRATGGALEPRRRSPPGTSRPGHRRQRPRVRGREPCRGRRRDRLRTQQVLLELLSACPDVPPPLVEQVAARGRLIAPVLEDTHRRLTLSREEGRRRPAQDRRGRAVGVAAGRYGAGSDAHA